MIGFYFYQPHEVRLKYSHYLLYCLWGFHFLHWALQNTACQLYMWAPILWAAVTAWFSLLWVFSVLWPDAPVFSVPSALMPTEDILFSLALCQSLAWRIISWLGMNWKGISIGLKKKRDAIIVTMEHSLYPKLYLLVNFSG